MDLEAGLLGFSEAEQVAEGHTILSVKELVSPVEESMDSEVAVVGALEDEEEAAEAAQRKALTKPTAE